MELYTVSICMQKCSLTTSANNRKVSVIPGHLLAGLPPAGMADVEGNSSHTSVAELNAGEFTKPIQKRQCATATAAILVIIALHG